MPKSCFVFVGLALLAVAVSCGGTAISEEANPATSELGVSLEPTFESPEALAEAFLRALERADGATLDSLALTKEQFREFVWPQLPSSRPERNVSFDFGWGDLYQKSHNALLFTFDEYEGESLQLVEIRFEDGLSDYETYVVHRDARVKVRRANGTEEWLDLFGSVMEWQGRYKLFSNVTD